ncbi:PHD finger protein 24 [Trichoplax sp. H2]|nr:PHD finger protein 24 [Trichoplax sp. H2]|eukprot:RDD39741.1 PHD finger protein 24 [Trichoplax sp. H2]
MGIVFGRNRNKMVQAATTAVATNNMKNSGSHRKLPVNGEEDKENNDHLPHRDENIHQGKLYAGNHNGNDRDSSNGDKVTYQDSNQAWARLKANDPTLDDDLRAAMLSRKKSLKIGTFDLCLDHGVTTELPKANLTYIIGPDEKVLADTSCAVCNVYNVANSELYPCRICTRVYHEQCLNKLGECKEGATPELLYNAKNFRWSCPKCENIHFLLEEDEMQELIDHFQQLDIDQDSTVTLEEYMKATKAQYEKEREKWTEVEEKYHQEKFRLMDKNSSGTLDWWEFLNAEAVKKLAKRDKEFLLSMLTNREVERARDAFQTIDLDKDGVITVVEAKRTFSHWFSKLLGKQYWNVDKVEQELPGHVEYHIHYLMLGDSDRNGILTWDEYLLDNALYFISCRPNVVQNH